MTTIKQKVYRFSALVAVVGVVLSPVAASAVADTDNTTVNAVVAPTISMTTSGTVTINITPTGSGAMSSSSDSVSVSTNHGGGYNLTLANTDATRTLSNGTDTLAADTGTQGAASSTLTNNSWGYRVDGLADFGAGPTSAETNVASSTYKWAGVPATGSANTLKTTAATASNDTTTVWYGVKVDTTK